MIIELRIIHVNINYLYLTQVYYQQIRNGPIEMEQARGSGVRLKDETHMLNTDANMKH